MDEAVERVARAICREIEKPGVDYSAALGAVVEKSVNANWPRYRGAAEAAIAAHLAGASDGPARFPRPR